MPPPLCKFDAKGCYQKNLEHFKKYSHPEKDKKALAAKAIAGAAAAGSAAKKAMVQPKLDFGASAVPPAGGASPGVKPHILGDDDDEELLPTPSSEPIAQVTAARGKRSRDDEGQTAPVVAGGGGGSASPHQSPRKPSGIGSTRPAGSTSRAGSTASTQFGVMSTTSEAAAVLATPKSRPSLTGILSASSKNPASAASLPDVFEMPYPVDQIDGIVKLAKELNPNDPCRAFPGCRLVGPFQVLCGYNYKSDEDKWTHWRSKYDPPEVQTIVVPNSDASTTAQVQAAAGGWDKVKGSLHFGLHRDDPTVQPGMVVLGSAYDPHFKIISNNIVHAIMMCVPSTEKNVIGKLRKLSPESPAAAVAPIIKKRNKECVAKSVSGLGVNVPFDKKNELGYRDPMYSTNHFMGLVGASNNNATKEMTPKQQEELYEQYRFADIANDECDFGLSLELGLNMFTAVKSLNAVAMNTHRILDTAYMLLGRDLFGHILQCHMPVLVGKKNLAPEEGVRSHAA